MKATFKVHKAEPRDVVGGVHRAEMVTLHPIDPHETGFHEHTRETRSGNGKFKLLVDDPKALGKFKPGALVTLTFEF